MGGLDDAPNGTRPDDEHDSPRSISTDTFGAKPKLHLITELSDLTDGDESGKELVPFNQPENWYPMRVALIQTAAGLKPPSGGYRANYATLYALSTYGHRTMQLCWAFSKDINMALAELKQAGMLYDKDFLCGKINMIGYDGNEFEVTWWKFYDVHGVRCICLDAETMLAQLPNEIQGEDAAVFIETGEMPPRIAAYAGWMSTQLDKWGPTHVIFNDALASKVTSTMSWFANHGVRVEVIHTAEQIPAGPYTGGIPGSATTNAELTLWENIDGIVSVSEAIHSYAEAHCPDVKTTMIPNHAWTYMDKDSHLWPRRRTNFARQRVAMVNPAYVKGYDIFLAMAKENQIRGESQYQSDKPTYNYVAYASWGSSSEMKKELQNVGVRVFDSEIDMEPVFDGISVLVVPSLWYEAWGIVATEAQLRGIPVLAADVGGLAEAKRHVGPLLEVNMIDGTKRKSDGTYIIPPQNVTPWIEQLDKLLTDRAYYETCAMAAYITTRNWCDEFDVRRFEKYLLSLKK